MYYLNRRAKRIITFHNVLPDDIINSVPRIGCMESVSEFKKKIQEISNVFCFSTDLNDPKTVTVTFDDGMINQREVAGKILQECGIPAIMFVAGDVIGVAADDALVTDKILLWNRFASDDAVKEVFGVSPSRDELWVKYVQPAYREDWRSRGRGFLTRLEAVYPISEIVKSLPHEWVRLRLCGVTGAQIEELSQMGWKIGWHTKSHFPLGMLDSAAKRDELSSPAEYRSVVLSYPYGDIGAIGDESIRIAEELGYPCAVSNDPDFSSHRGKFFLMRMALPSNKYELHFVLSGLKYFIKHRKLLPKVGVCQGEDTGNGASGKVLDFQADPRSQQAQKHSERRGRDEPDRQKMPPPCRAQMWHRRRAKSWQSSALQIQTKNVIITDNKHESLIGAGQHHGGSVACWMAGCD